MTVHAQSLEGVHNFLLDFLVFLIQIWLVFGAPVVLLAFLFFVWFLVLFIFKKGDKKEKAKGRMLCSIMVFVVSILLWGTISAFAWEYAGISKDEIPYKVPGVQFK